MRRTADEAAETRVRIVQAALATFSERGYQSANLTEIATAAGVTRGAIYHHFDGKAGLYQAIVDDAAAKGADVLQRAIAGGGTWLEVCRRVFTALHTEVEHDPSLRAASALVLRETHAVPELHRIRQQQQAAGRDLQKAVAGFMREGTRTGALRTDIDPAELARAFLSLNQGLLHLWLAGGSDFCLRDSSSVLVEILLTGIRRPEPLQHADGDE